MDCSGRTPVELYCAVDVRGGRCVRLRQGDYTAEVVYDDNPVSVAARMAEAGADWIHVVDLDGARSGKPENAEVVAAVATAVNVPVQAGGGVRSKTTAEAWFAAGVERVVLGTAALQDPETVCSLARSHRVAVALDARSGEIATDGWLRPSGRSVLEVAASFSETEVDALIVTDISRDGMLRGPDLDGLSRVLTATEPAAAAMADEAAETSEAVTPSASANVFGSAASGGAAEDDKLAGDVPICVIASGGVSSLSDLRAVAQLRSASGSRRRLSGVIVGKALYEKCFTVTEAVAALSDSATGS